MKSVPHRTVGRLSLYWRILRDLAPKAEAISIPMSWPPRRRHRRTGAARPHGHRLHRNSCPRLRRPEAPGHIEAFLFPATEQKAVIAGVGNIGRALLKFFAGRRPTLKIVASFEVNPEKFDRMIHGCPCHSIENAESVIRDMGITVGIIAVPDKEAQYVADVFVDAGIRGILNFARTPLHVPPGVYVEDIDLAMSMDKVAYFARQSSAAPKHNCQKRRVNHE